MVEQLLDVLGVAAEVLGPVLEAIDRRNEALMRDTTTHTRRLGSSRRPFNPLPDLAGQTGRHPSGPSESYGALKSHAGPRCRVDFINRTDVELRVLWLDFKGKKVQYGVMPPGGRHAGLRTFTTHPWVVEDWNGTVYAIYVGGSATVTVNGRDDFTVKSGVNQPDTDVSKDSVRTRILTLLRSHTEAEAPTHNDAGSEASGESSSSNAREASDAEAVAKGSRPGQEEVIEEGGIAASRKTRTLKKRTSWLGWCLQSKESLLEEGEEQEEEEELQTTQKSTFKGEGNSCHTCPICCDSLENDVWALACGHMLHSSCLASALERGLECPVCRQAVVGEEDLRRLYPS